MKPNISPSFLDSQQDQLLKFVILMHGDQKRKYTDEPYWYHVVNVAYRADVVAGRLGIEIALCHDLIEDTDCTYELLIEYLKVIGYMIFDIDDIIEGVCDLTDVFTQEAYPKWPRARRKELEANRLAKISARSQNIKCCDIEDNSDSILEHDPEFAKIYIPEMVEVLRGMTKANPNVRLELLEKLK